MNGVLDKAIVFVTGSSVSGGGLSNSFPPTSPSTDTFLGLNGTEWGGIGVIATVLIAFRRPIFETAKRWVQPYRNKLPEKSMARPDSERVKASEITQQPRVRTFSESHWEALRAGELVLDCSPYRMAANPNVYTYTRTACEALAELRSNMRLLSQYREASEDSSKPIPTSLFTYSSIKNFIVREKFETPYGLKKEKLNGLVEELQVASLALAEAQTHAQLVREQLQSQFTIDDLFIYNGFLDWIVSHEMKDELRPPEIYELGPFYDRAFPRQNQQDAVAFVVRESEPYADVEEGVEYVTILSAFD